MLEPIRDNSRVILELRVNSTLLDKTYELWVDLDQHLTMMMHVKKYIRLNQTIYEFLTYEPLYSNFCLAATMESNIDRN